MKTGKTEKNKPLGSLSPNLDSVKIYSPLVVPLTYMYINQDNKDPGEVQPQHLIT